MGLGFFGFSGPLAPNGGFFLGGGDMGRGGALLTPSELVLTFGVVTFVSLLAKIDQVC